MGESQLLALKPELDRSFERLAPLFGRDENRAHARRFVRGLLHGGERRNAEDIAQALSGGPVRSLQAFLATGAWLDTAALDELRRAVREVLADDDAAWNSDETGFPKKGTKSVGVKRQDSGTPGRADDRRVAVLAGSCSAKGHTFMDRRLFLPEGWADDRDRRDEAGVPAGVIFRTEPALALEMVAGAVAEGIPSRRVGGDGVHGDSPGFVQGVRLLGKRYVLDSSADARVWTTGPRAVPPGERPKPKRGRPYGGRSRRTSSRARGSAAWTSTRRGAGRVGTTTRRCRWGRRRSLCCSGGDWGGKEPGLTVPEVRALPAHLLEVRARDVAEILRWSAWRRERNRRAAASHRERRLAERRRQRSRATDPAL